MISADLNKRLHSIAPVILGAIAATIGVAGFSGWLFHSPFLLSISESFVSMKPHTAIGLTLLGLATVMLGVRPNKRPVQLCASVLSFLVLTLGTVTLAQYVLAIDFGIDQVLFKDYGNSPDTWSPGRMAAITCVTFVISGLALHCKAMDNVRTRKIPDILALATSFTAIFVILGYVYNTEALRNMGMYGGMAIHTAVGFLLLSLAILLLRPETSLLAPVLSGSPVGLVMRWILPTVVVGPVIVGMLRQWGEQAGLYSHGDGIALGVVTTIFALVVLTLCASHAIDRANDKTLQAEGIIRKFFDLSNDLLCVANMDGHFVKVNRSWERTLGFTIEELTRRPFVEFVHPDDVESTMHEYERQAAGSDVISFENRYRCMDGSYRTLLWNATQPMDGGLIYASAHDITDRKQAEREIATLNSALSVRAYSLEAINAELEAFSYSVSHDLRAPLRSIDGFSQALLEDYSDKLDGTGQDFLRRVRSATQRMGQLIDDMLQLSRVTRSEFNRERVDLTMMANAIVSALREKYPKRLVVVDIQSQLLADCDPRLTRIALENLIDNAWKYTSKKEAAHIHFGIHGSGPVPVYVVSDDGVGFDLIYSKKLFSPFQRLHGQEEFEGTGIGLATVKRIIARHGGSVWAEGVTNEGAAFYFTLTSKTGQGGNDVPENNPLGRGQSGRRSVDAPCT